MMDFLFFVFENGFFTYLTTVEMKIDFKSQAAML